MGHPTQNYAKWAVLRPKTPVLRPFWGHFRVPDSPSQGPRRPLAGTKRRETPCGTPWTEPETARVAGTRRQPREAPPESARTAAAAAPAEVPRLPGRGGQKRVEAP